MVDLSDLSTVRIFYLKSPEGNMQATFMIDGRTYSNPDDVRRDTWEAYQAIDDRLIVAESEVRSLEPNSPAPCLPTWQEYKHCLPPLKGSNS
jgi:hypothetical protein